MKIYLDVCCLNRPFDDQTQDRIHLEAEAIISILRHIESSEWLLIGSGVINYEISRTPDEERRNRLQSMVQGASVFVAVDKQTQLRATTIQDLGIRAYDALHVACAERGGADVMLSTDDKLVRLAQRNNDRIRIEILNPLVWLQKVV